MHDNVNKCFSPLNPGESTNNKATSLTYFPVGEEFVYILSSLILLGFPSVRLSHKNSFARNERERERKSVSPTPRV